MKKIAAIVVCIFLAGCNASVHPGPTAVSGVREVAPEVPLGTDGLTSEQRNVRERLKQDNKPGAVKHLYVFSAFSGQCILYSTVREKVTSSGKRLSPTTVAAGRGGDWSSGVSVKIGNDWHRTGEVLQDDGTYGKSIEYLYWFDQGGNYRQMYVTGGMLYVVSSTPLPVKSVTVNVETKKE